MHAVLLPGKLNVCHGNAQSICARKSNKLEELKLILQNSKVSVACLTESWLSSKNSDRSVAIPGFKVHRNDRSYRRGGGIVVYIEEHLPCSRMFSTQLSDESIDKTECLALELRPGREKVLLIVVYNPPDNDCARFLEEKLVDLAGRYNHVLLIGDFNTDLSRPSRRRDSFQSMLQNLAMTSVGSEPTYFHREGCSQLDLLITSDIGRMLRFSQVSFPALSQHDLIFGSLDFDAAPRRKINAYRDYVNFNANALENGIRSIPWGDFDSLEDPNDLLRFFTTHLKQVHDHCIPLRNSNIRNEHNAWFNADVGRSILERDLAYRDWRRAPPDAKQAAWNRYKALRNRTNSLITTTKAEYVNRLLDHRLPQPTLWKRLKRVGMGKDTAPIACDFHPDQVNGVFLSNYTASDPARRPRNETQPSPHCFSFHPVEYWEVINAIWDVNSNATGLDGLPIKFIKLVLPLVVHQVTHMFNRIITTSTFPRAWKHAKVLPLRKKPQINSLENLRPISILCALSKAFEKLLEQQMSAFISNHNLLSEHQAGFRKGQGVQTAVLRVYDDLASVVDKKGSAVLVLLDFSKAFDTIPHAKLCSKLETQFNFSASAVSLVESYLEERSQTVFCGDQQSESGEITSGVAQGSVLGPRFFCCHINDLPTIVNNCSVQMYADDVQLYIARRGPSSRDLVRLVNEDLARISEWCTRNKLIVNQSKSKAIFMRGQRRNISRTDLMPNVTMDGINISWTESASNLGFVMQSDLRWDGFISQQCGKIYAGLRTLSSCVSAAPAETKLKLFKTLIFPHFLFGDLLHVNPSAGDMDRLRVALNCCVRFVFGLDRYSRVSHLQQRLIGCPLQNFYAYRACLFIRKLLNTRSPPFLYQKLIISQGRRLQNLVIPANYSTSYASSLFVRGVVYWNTLPTTLKREPSEAIFRKGCLQYFNH